MFLYIAALFSMGFHQAQAEIFLDEMDLKITCNVTRLLAALNVDPILIVEKTSDVLDKVFGLQYLDDKQDLMTTNIERMMITALMMEFIPDLAHWKSEYRQQCESSAQNPVPEASTYKIDITNKGEAKSGITSSIELISTQRGIINGFGKSPIRETVSNNKFKKSDAETKFSSIDINTPGTKDGFTTGTQSFNTALGILVEIPTLLSLFANALTGGMIRENLWEEMSNSSSFTASLDLDPIAGACGRMRISVPFNSTDPNTWWQGIDSIRAIMATTNVDLSYTRPMACLEGA